MTDFYIVRPCATCAIRSGKILKQLFGLKRKQYLVSCYGKECVYSCEGCGEEHVE